MYKLFLLCIIAITLTGQTLAGDPKANKKAFFVAYKSYAKAIENGNHPATLKYAQTAYTLMQGLSNITNKQRAAVTYNYGKAILNYSSSSSGKNELATEKLKEALDLYKTLYGTGSAKLIDTLMDLGTANLEFYSKPDEHFKEALKITETHYGTQSEMAGIINQEIGVKLLTRSHSSSALDYIKKAQNIFSQHDSHNSKIRLAMTDFWLGKYYLAANKNKPATSALLSSLEAMSVVLPESPLILTTHAFLIQAYEKQNKRDKATKHCLAIGKTNPENPDQDYQPVYQAQPFYPTKARELGFGGSATVEMTIDKKGFVKNPKIIASEVSSIFKKPALDAIKKFRYIPRFKNGEPIETEGVRYKFSFNIAK